MVSASLHLPVGDPAVDDLDRGQHAGDGGERVGDGHARPGEVGRHDEGHLGLDPWLEQRLDRDLVALVDEHVVEQHAEVGLVDAEESCIGPRGRPDRRPRTTAPAATRRSTLWVWIA